MAPLLQADPARQALELRRAELAEAAVRAWRRSWRVAYAQCIGLFLLGYILYGVSWGLTEPRQVTLVLSASVLVSYLLPLVRLLAFFLRFADQF